MGVQLVEVFTCQIAGPARAKVLHIYGVFGRLPKMEVEE